MMPHAPIRPQIFRIPGDRLGAYWIEAVWTVALIPPLAEALWSGGGKRLQLVAQCVLLAFIWEALFAVLYARRFSPYSLVAALAFACLAPDTAPFWQLALGLSFGLVIGVHIFGGHGWHFVNPVAVAFAFLIFAFSPQNYSSLAFPSWQVALPGALLLIAAGVVSWRIIFSAFLALAVILSGLTGGTAALAPLILSFLFPVVFLAGDPVAAPAVNAARWVYGAGTGLLLALQLASGKAPADAVFAAILLGNIFAPLADHAAVLFHINRREANHG